MLGHVLPPPPARSHDRARGGGALARLRDARRRPGGYWAVIKAPELVRSPNDPAVIAAARTVPRGIDPRPRRGDAGAQRRRTRTASCYRVYRGPAISQVVGYASARYGRAGLELAYDAELSGLAGDPVADALRKFGTDPYDPKDLTLALSLELQRAAVRALGDHNGAVVMLDPRNGRGPRTRLHADVRRLGAVGSRYVPTRRSRRSRTTSASRYCRARRWAATSLDRCSRS